MVPKDKSLVPIPVHHLSINLVHLCGRGEGRSNGTEPDVGVDNSSTGGVGLDVLRLSRVGRARSTANTRGRGVLVSGVGRVEPKHVDRVVVPERHDENVATSKRSTHSVKATELLEVGLVTEGSLLLVAELVGDGVSFDARDAGVSVLEDLAVLDVEALNLGQAGAGADELSYNGHLLAGVERHSRAVEVLCAHTVALLLISLDT
jgi:hypothetical protein